MAKPNDITVPRNWYIKSAHISDDANLYHVIETPEDERDCPLRYCVHFTHAPPGDSIVLSDRFVIVDAETIHIALNKACNDLLKLTGQEE